MSKWREVKGINPAKSDALISAGCRYMNSAAYPSAGMLAAIIGLEEIEETAELPETEEISYKGDE